MLVWLLFPMRFFVSKAIMSLKTSLAGATAAIGLTALAYPAQAALYNLTYTHGTPVGNPITFSAKLTGTASGQVITVTGFSDAKYNGFSFPSWTYLDTYTGYLVGPSTPGSGVVSLDNSVTNITFGTADFSQIVAFGPAGGTVGNSVIFTSFGFDPTFGADTNSGEETLGTLTVTEISQQPIPEPSAVVALLGLGLGALASKVRKQG
ncbi:PEP-CTERM sorting domain-containing protein [Microcystis sp. M061S2]|uniref:PEP-CTERM sorting domain-containing protein n=1 Tax=Microcystis sp. M061S2 TaxID=2771171 RepID=UPI0025875A52|nr:PEP-CTERM sorting domain-containing protein [Microcystis sp. M061S2]MCA2655196.1 PEP-CTERM sorting domain-containing protein [Microcystis sp. M061S2]